MSEVPRISDAEWEVMHVVWERHPVDARTVSRQVPRERRWSLRTVKTLLARLVEKGALGYSPDGKRYLYRPLVSREDCLREASRSFLDRVFGGAVRPAVLTFVRESDLPPEEVAEIERLLGGEEEEEE